MPGVERAGLTNQTPKTPLTNAVPSSATNNPLSRSAGEGWGEGPGRSGAYQPNPHHRDQPRLRPTSMKTISLTLFALSTFLTACATAPHRSPDSHRRKGDASNSDTHPDARRHRRGGPLRL